MLDGYSASALQVCNEASCKAWRRREDQQPVPSIFCKPACQPASGDIETWLLCAKALPMQHRWLHVNAYTFFCS
jgi:hypothetical protein